MILLIDTETCNSLEDPIVYDVGLSIFDEAGVVHEERSYVNKDIFLDKEMMETAFYKDKIPQYWADIWARRRKLMPWREIRNEVYNLCKDYKCEIAVAHNARFDNRSLNLTQRFITTSKYRFFLPYGVVWHDTLKMCRELFGKDKVYLNWCIQNNFMTKTHQPKMTAEVVYKYISGNLDFVEAHTGFEDTQIEKEIYLYCKEKIPDFDSRLFPPEEELQRQKEPWEIELEKLIQSA